MRYDFPLVIALFAGCTPTPEPAPETPDATDATDATAAAATDTAGGWAAGDLDPPAGGGATVPVPCGDEGASWRGVNPPPIATALRGVRAFGDGQTVAVGEWGRVVRWDGQSVRVLRQDATQALNDVDGTGPEDLWVVGDGGLVLHYDGLLWKQIDSHTQRDLTSVSVSPAGVWMLGEDIVLRYADGVIHQEPDGSKAGEQPFADIAADGEGAWMVGGNTVWRFDGKKWEATELAGQKAHLRLTAVASRGADKAWAVGTAGATGVILAFDGQQWTEFPGRLEGVTDVAVGGVLPHGQGRVYALLENGRTVSWNAGEAGVSEMDPPAAGGVLKIDATADGPVAVGAAGWMQRYDQGWQTQTSRFPAEDMEHVWGTGADDLWASSGAKLYQREAGKWSPNNAPGNTARILAIGGTGPGDTWALTEDFVMRWDGDMWTKSEAFDGPATHGDLWVAEGGDAWLIAGKEPTGKDGVMTPGWLPKLFHFAGGQWAEVQVDSDVGTPQQVWASGPTDAWVVGSKGVFHYVNLPGDTGPSDWHDMKIAKATDVWGSNADNVWIAAKAADGTLELTHWDGKTLAKRAVPELSGEARLTGRGGTVYATDGEMVVQISGEFVTKYSLRMDDGAFADFVALGTNDLYVAGDYGAVVRRTCPVLKPL
jgi:hypothetical protein